MFVVPRSRFLTSMSEVLWLLYDLPRKEERKENKMVVKIFILCNNRFRKKKKAFFFISFVIFFFISNQQVKTVGVSEGRSMLPYLDGHTGDTTCCLHYGQKKKRALRGTKLDNTLPNILCMHLFVRHFKIHDFGLALWWIY